MRRIQFASLQGASIRFNGGIIFLWTRIVCSVPWYGSM